MGWSWLPWAPLCVVQRKKSLSRCHGGWQGGTALSQLVTPTEEDKGEEVTADTDLEIRRLRLTSAFPGTLSKLGSVYPAVQWGRFYRW